jgi:hypothetical protein
LVVNAVKEKRRPEIYMNMVEEEEEEEMAER